MTRVDLHHLPRPPSASFWPSQTNQYSARLRHTHKCVCGVWAVTDPLPVIWRAKRNSCYPLDSGDLLLTHCQARARTHTHMHAYTHTQREHNHPSGQMLITSRSGLPVLFYEGSHHPNTISPFSSSSSSCRDCTGMTLHTKVELKTLADLQVKKIF